MPPFDSKQLLLPERKEVAGDGSVQFVRANKSTLPNPSDHFSSPIRLPGRQEALRPRLREIIQEELRAELRDARTRFSELKDGKRTTENAENFISTSLPAYIGKKSFMDPKVSKGWGGIPISSGVVSHELFHNVGHVRASIDDSTACALDCLALMPTPNS